MQVGVGAAPASPTRNGAPLRRSPGWGVRGTAMHYPSPRCFPSASRPGVEGHEDPQEASDSVLAQNLQRKGHIDPASVRMGMGLKSPSGISQKR